MQYKLSIERNNLIALISAFVFIVPIYLSLKGITALNIVFFTGLIISNSTIYLKVQFSELFLFSFLFLVYLSSYFLFDIGTYGIEKSIMLILSLILYLIISISVLNINMFLIYTSYLITIAGFIILIIFLQNGESLSVNNRLESGIINPIWMGRFAAVAFIIIYDKNKTRKNFLFLAVNFIIVIFSGSKGPLLGLIAVYLFHYRKNISFTRLILFLGLSAIFIITFLNMTFIEFFVSRFLSFNPNSQELIQEIEGDRLSMFFRTTKNYIENIDIPVFLFGLGPNQSSYYYYGSVIDERWYPHNIILELLYEYGFCSIFLFLFALRKSEFWKKSLINSLILFCLVNSFFSGDLPLNGFLFFFIILKLVRKIGIEKATIYNA
jgi:hypothetical protein